MTSLNVAGSNSSVDPTITAGASQSIWYKTPPISFKPLDRNLHTDVLIIGAGMAGLHIAYELLMKGKSDVTVIDDGSIASGESGRTSAHLTSHLDDRFQFIMDMMGKEKASLAYQAHARAIDRIEEIAKLENIECQFKRVDAYLIEGHDKHHPQFEKNIKIIDDELTATHEVGFTSTRIVDRAPVPGIDTGRALLTPNQAQFHPTMYLNGLAKAIVRLGGKIFTNTHAQEINGGTPAVVETKDGKKIQSNFLVQATNIPIVNKITITDRVECYRSYVVAFLVPKGEVPQVLIYDLADPYHYARVIPGEAHEHYDTLLVGGEDHEVGTETEKGQQDCYAKLENWTRERWPMAGAIIQRWSGQIIEPLDAVGIIGNNPHDEKNVYIVTGDSGDGLTNAAVSGMLLSDLIIGRQNEWAKLYDPTRKFLKMLPGYFKHMMAISSRYIRWLQRGDIPDIESLPTQCGGVIFEGGHHVAVYKDEDGKVHRYTAVCPHMQGIVKYNKPEKSFDCPVHGSRFTCYGQVINGPAKSDLAPMPEPTE